MFGLGRIPLYGLLLAAWAGSVWLHGQAQWKSGRAALTQEIAVAVAERRAADGAALEDITDEIENTPDADLVGIIVDGGWLLPDD